MEPTDVDETRNFINNAVQHGWFENEGVLLCRADQATVRAFSPGSQQGDFDQDKFKPYKLEGRKCLTMCMRWLGLTQGSCSRTLLVGVPGLVCCRSCIVSTTSLFEHVQYAVCT